MAAAASASVAPAALALGREEAAPGTAQVAPSVVGASGLLLALLPAALLAPKTSALRLRLPLVLPSVPVELAEAWLTGIEARRLDSSDSLVRIAAPSGSPNGNFWDWRVRLAA